MATSGRGISGEDVSFRKLGVALKDPLRGP